MDKDIALLLGGNKLNAGVAASLESMGFKVIVVDWNERPAVSGFRHYAVDVKDFDSIVSALETDGLINRVGFAYTSIDLAVPIAAALNAIAGLSVIGQEGLSLCSSKGAMTSRWRDCGLLNRESIRPERLDGEVVDFIRCYDAIVKPDNSASSRGITVLRRGCSRTCAERAFEKARREAPNSSVVIEEFVSGLEYTVEMLGDSHGSVCVYAISRKSHTSHAGDNRIAVKLHYNCEGENLQRRIADFGIECYRALGFSASLGHLEVMLREDGSLSPVEIGARSSGFIASDLADIVSGSSYLGDLLAVHRGGKVSEGLHPQTDRAGVLFFYDFPEGLPVVSPCSLLDFCDSSIRSRHGDRSAIKRGAVFGKVESDNSRYGYEVLEGPRDLLTPEYLEAAERSMIAEMFGG